jgi:serine/threonine protein kinase
LTDFGLARAVDDASLTQHGTIAGTPQYMSPEQSRGEAVDQASDLFSLGSVLYTLCSGRVPFRAESSHSVMRKIIDEAPTPIRELNPEIPDWLVGIIDRLMAKDKMDRFQSAKELHTLLDACLSHVQQPLTIDLPESLRSPVDGGRKT